MLMFHILLATNRLFHTVHLPQCRLDLCHLLHRHCLPRRFQQALLHLCPSVNPRLLFQ